MREIKFRGKRIDSGEWVYGGIIQYGDYVAIIQHSDYHGWHTFIEVDPATVGQFTGLRDKNRREIFEDDLLQSPVGAMYIWQVKFEDGAYILEQINGLKKREKRGHVQDFCCEDVIELYQLVKIGNIHDNPELLRCVVIRNCP